MAQLLDTTIKGRLVVNLNNGTDPHDSKNLNGIYIQKLNGPKTDFYDQPAAALYPWHPVRMDLGTSNRPWLRTHTRGLRIYASNASYNNVTDNTEASPFLAGRLYIIDDDPNSDSRFPQESTLRLQLGNNNTGSNHIDGEIIMYRETDKWTKVKAHTELKDNITITLPSQSGTLSIHTHTHDSAYAKANHNHKFSSSDSKDSNIFFNNRNWDKDKNTIKNQKEISAQLRYSYVWGSNDLDIFIVRGYCLLTIPAGTIISAGKRIWVGSISTGEDKILPLGLVPLAIYRHTDANTIPWQGCLTKQAKHTSANYYYSEFYVKPGKDIGSKTKDISYGFYFTATYGRIGEGEIVDTED